MASPPNRKPLTRLFAGAFAVATSIGVAACAPVEKDSYQTAVADGSERQCFFARSITGYREAPDGPDGSERLYVDVGANDTYLFEVFGACPSLDFSWNIGFDTYAGSRICDGLDVELVVPDPSFGPQRCPVRMISKVVPEGD